MTQEEWRAGAGFFLEAHGVVNFTAEEICPVGKTHKTATLYAPPPEFILNSLKLIEGPLDWIRWYEGSAPVGVNSWFRSEAYNRSVGGGKNSIHLTGGAADITKRRWTPLRIALAFAHDYPMAEQLGIGLYPTFVHVDIRGMIGRRAPARWTGKGAEKNWWKKMDLVA